MRIGLVVNILDEEYQISIYDGIRSRAKELGITLVCIQQENTHFYPQSFLAHFPEENFFNLDGIILLTSVVVDNNEINHKEDVQKVWKNLPVVSIGQKIQGIPSLLIKTDESMKQLVEHLIFEHNYRNFVYISGPQNHHDAIIRENIFCETVDEHKSEYPDLNYTIKRGWFTEQAAIEAMAQFYNENPNANPDVIVCANDNMAIGVYKYFKMNHKNPSIKACAVTGFDDIPQARFEIPSLTTIRQPMEKIGRESLDTLLREINGEKNIKNSFVKSQVLFRKSCGCKQNELDISDDFVDKMHTNYVQSERMLRMVSHIGQDLNLCETDGGLRYIVNVNMEQLDIQNFCILKYQGKNYKLEQDIETFMVKPVYVRRNGRFFHEFDGNKIMTIGQFYKKYLDYDNTKPESLVLKFLFSGNEIIGCVFYDSSIDILPYVCSISINIAQAMNRISVSEERRRYSEFLEKEVNKRTKELIKANNRRMEVEAEVLRISEIERQRFSNDLHDDICQRLAGISMLCRSYSNQNEPVEKNQMVELAELISDTLQTTRQYAHNSYPVELESLGMNHSISNLCHSFEVQSGIKCEYQWNLKTDSIFDKTQKLNIFRIIQEALHNAMKHSKATVVKVCVKAGRNDVIVEISDNGCGIQKTKSSEKGTNGLGLNSMQYRANQIGASFTIKSNKPVGTTIQVKLKV
ncbi:MAG: substrate-binding domain-containing protein [Treponema sp.]|nr:substrate-binding domain-containing protein [Treponema sp.]